MAKILMKGNEAIALAAVKGGLDAYFGYPITPQNEVPEYLSKYMLENGKVFVQAESELAAINMVYGAAGAGVRAMTSSSSPGIALMQEGITYIAGAQLPCVIVNVMRSGPGLGGIAPSQADYNQITRGGGNGDYNVIAYAPETLQETVNIMKSAFDTADYWRSPVMIAVDGMIGQMMEAIDLDLPVPKRELPPKDWASTGGHRGADKRLVTSFCLEPADLAVMNDKLKEKYNRIIAEEQKWDMVNMDGAEVAIVAYGTMSRICRSAIELLAEQGIKVGLLRPITIWPFPEKAFAELPASVKGIMSVELSNGQMIDDIRIANNGRLPVGFFGRGGGLLPSVEDTAAAIAKFVEEVR